METELTYYRRYLLFLYIFKGSEYLKLLIYIILEIAIDDYVGIWKRIGSDADHACHQISDDSLECKSSTSAPQILTIRGRNFSWFIDSANLVLNGTYIGNDVIKIQKTLWVKQGIYQITNFCQCIKYKTFLLMAMVMISGDFLKM